MESTSIRDLLKAALNAVPYRTFSIVVAFAFVHLFVGTERGLAQPSETTPSRLTKIADVRFATPDSTTAFWTEAVNNQNWREEYDCYTGAQQAKFTYQVMVSTRELSDSQDLSIELGKVLRKHRFPPGLLDEFPSTRMDLSHLSDQEQIQSAIARQNEKRQKQLDRWEREVQPLDIDWAGMIGDLQPLFFLSYQRHKDGVHPSSNGIARHLSYHRFNDPSNLEIEGIHANGSVIAFARNEDAVVDEDKDEGDLNRSRKLFSWLDRRFQKVLFTERRVTRPAEKVSLVREAEGWKIEVVPFR